MRHSFLECLLWLSVTVVNAWNWTSLILFFIVYFIIYAFDLLHVQYYINLHFLPCRLSWLLVQSWSQEKSMMPSTTLFPNQKQFSGTSRPLGGAVCLLTPQKDLVLQKWSKQCLVFGQALTSKCKWFLIRWKQQVSFSCFLHEPVKDASFPVIINQPAVSHMKRL